MKKISIPTKEEIIDYYINQLHSRKETCEFFKISNTTFARWLRFYKIAKSEDVQAATRSAKYDSEEAKQQVKEKRRLTCLKKYGVENATQSPIVRQKTVQTCLKKYGHTTPSLDPQVQQKTKETNLKRYGVEYAINSPQIQSKIRKKLLDTTGAPYVNQQHIQHLEIWNDAQRFEQFLDSYTIKPTVRTLMEYFNVSDVSIGIHARVFNVVKKIDFRPTHSHYEDEIINVLKCWGINNIQNNNKSLLHGREIDIYLPDYNFGIEFNGNYWHSDYFYKDHNGRSLHHQQKSLLAESKGVFLFHIFEYEWLNPTTKSNILNRLYAILGKNNIKIPARKCKIQMISKKQKKEFLNKYHIQGNDHSTLDYGLFYQDELVSCMTFVHPKNNKYTWELSRFCNKHNYVVQGGASKLFKHFVDTLKSGDTISSYNDITKTNGKIYEILGFECKSINQPNYVWINFNTNDIRTRYQEQAAGEVKRMQEQNYHRLCDCGTKTWVYIVK